MIINFLYSKFICSKKSISNILLELVLLLEYNIYLFYIYKYNNNCHWTVKLIYFICNYLEM